MTTIHYDYERLRQAVVLLLDLRYGKTRSEKLRGSIMSDRRPDRFQKPIAALNEFFVLASQSRVKALELLDLTDRRRERNRAAELANPSPGQHRRLVIAKSIADTRARLKFATEIHEIEIGRKLNGPEKKDFQKVLSAAWAERRRKYRKESGLPAGDANTVFSRMLDEELQEQYQTAKREEERRRLSDTSRRRLEAKEAYKNSQKTGVSQETLAKLTRKFGGT